MPSLERVGMVAGEASGDLLAAALLAAMRARWPQVRAQGVGGHAMQAQGFEAWSDSEALAVRGYVEVLPKLIPLLRLRKRLGDRWLAQRPDVFVGVDAPDFNFDLERRLRQAGVPTVHFVSPSFWAWRPEKVLKLREAADHVLCLFPFEPALLAEHGVAATYVGHPLASVIPQQVDRPAAKQALGLQPDVPVVALLPGSRAAEIEHLADRFVQAARLVQAEHGRPVQFVMPAVPSQHARLAALLAAQGAQDQVRLLHGQSHAALAACDVTLIASGTATLEAALFGCPMVIAYAMPALSHWLMRRKQLMPWVGLPNILCQQAVVPELLQDQATPQALARAVLQWLHSPAEVAALRQRLARLHTELAQDTPTLACDAIANVVAARSGA
ncbi:lipid-A-disaccharide synthase [Comamonas serinivorans]|uniref:Lipid-A-disaccharide synthase n=1 Tax=Comamonas serinivorans TaxID=1082851 RepID=A0A1Y0ET84_9BURK|nr:lipid-A-disaccharide synthase [Comamonas serinivorans]ARU06884.1 lipid-A-disaccharide synthase [Comamonas serinivorans]